MRESEFDWVPRFLVVFTTYTNPAEWITASRLATRIIPAASSEFSKEVSRKLSNLERFGHLERRLTANGIEHEYRRVKPIRLSVEQAALFEFVPPHELRRTDPMPDF